MIRSIEKKLYGNWLVKSEQFLVKKTYYVIALCTLCNKEKTVKKLTILDGESKSCGCQKHKNLGILLKDRAIKNGSTMFNRESIRTYRSYKVNAVKRNLSFNISLNFFRELISQPCVYCGDNNGNAINTDRGLFKYNGIDRWNNKIGYEQDNCLPCCKKCNRMKSDAFDGSIFIEQIKKILDHHSMNFIMTEKKMMKYNLRLEAIKQNSPDEETKVAAILIDPKTGAVNAEGYNGFVRGAKDNLLPKIRPDKYPYMIHAEANVIYNSVRSGVGTDGKILFCSLSPCLNCCRFLYQCGIKTIYFKEKYRDFDKQLEALDINLKVESYFEYYKLTLSTGD